MLDVPHKTDLFESDDTCYGFASASRSAWKQTE